MNTKFTENCDSFCDIWGDLSEKSFSTRGTCQPHLQMLPAHMCAYCSMWGYQPLHATLNLAFIHPLDAPQLKAKGYHVGLDSHLWSLWLSWRGGFECQLCLTASRIRDFGCHLFSLLRGWLGDSGSWGRMTFLGRGGTEEMGVWVQASLRSL